MSIVKYSTGLRFHRCHDDPEQEDEIEMSRPKENEIVECPLCEEGIQAEDWDKAEEV